MNVSEIQQLLAAAGWYSGAIDGDAGSKTLQAVALAEEAQAGGYSGDPASWSRARRLIGAGQAVLHQAGFEPGAIDGYAGHNTAEALAAWQTDRAGNSAAVARVAIETKRSHANQMLYPRQSELQAFYGAAGGAQCTAGKVALAYPMVIAWNKRQRITSFSCHEKLARPLADIFRHTLAHYGQAGVERLNLDVFGGCFNFRKMRGGSSLSLHAYGAAIDLNPERNQLRWGADRAQFAGEDYVPFWNIVMAYGGTPAGYAWGKDWMHFQFARL
jgi:peptidoglycan hydrolase-like protein with peptidoglycan-binding domain